jgi:hypothetical protein
MEVKMSDKRNVRKFQIRIEATAAMLLLIVLAALTMLLISSTGRSYKNIVSAGGASQDIRTGLFFISTKVRQSDNGGNINVVKSPWGGNAVVISQVDAGTVYEDWIFYYGGALREISVPKGTQINPPACPVISSLSGFSVSQKGRELDITAQKKSPDKAGGQSTASQSLVLTLRT